MPPSHRSPIAAAKLPIAHLLGNRVAEEIAEDLEVSARTVQRWIEQGVNWQQADLFATKILRDHPLSVWGPAWHDLAEETPGKDTAPAHDNQPTLSDMFDFL